MEDNDTAAFQNSEISWSRTVRFWLLLSFEIPALICSLIVLCYLLMNRTRREALHNHSIIVLHLLALIFQLIDIPWYLDFIIRGVVWPQTPARCLVWWSVDLGVYNTAAIILAWTSIERHILVFHDRWVSTSRKRFFIHYLPLVTLLIYALTFYTITLFFPSCQHTYEYTLPVCAATPCHLLDPILGIWDMGIHGCLSTMIIACFSFALLIRVIMKKRRDRRIFKWKKYRKMITQLLFISTLYVVFNLPIMVMSLARLCGLPPDIGLEEQLIFFFLTYWVMLLLPMASLISLPNFKKVLIMLWDRHRGRQTTVFPFTKNGTVTLRHENRVRKY